MPEKIIPLGNNLEERLKIRAEQHRKIKDALDSLLKCPFMESIGRHRHFHEYYGSEVSHYPPEIKYQI